MWKYNKEAIQAVEQFNEKIMDAIGQKDYFSTDHLMMLETDGSQTIIKFMGIRLWFSEEDEREFKEEENDYEPLLGFLEKRAKEELERFSRVLLPKTEEET